MRIDILSAIPALLESPLSESIIRRARQNKVVEIHLHDLRRFGEGAYRQIDDEPFGGGAGMVLMPGPIFRAVRELQAEREYDAILFPSPDGERFTQQIANELSLYQNIIILCGHYKGVDERVREALITREISIGDYVVTGGELPAAIIVDAVVRLLPGAMHDAESALLDSFQAGMLDGPVYTRPASFEGLDVPEILLSGDHKKIAEWKQMESLKRTEERRPDLLE